MYPRRSSSAPRVSKRPERSLLARAIALLARREHSRLELARKLAPHAKTLAELELLLTDLQARKLLSEERFIEQLTRSKSARYGAARVRQELQSHELDSERISSAVAELKQTEYERAYALWQRKFGEPAVDQAERGRQLRFLLQRGFASAVAYRIVMGRESPEG